MKEVCKYLKIDTKDLREREILGEISSAKNELMTPLLYREENEDLGFRYVRIADAYEEYQKRLKKNNALDFDDLLMKTVELFHSHDEILASYQNRFRYIMVDEYQDTNNAQFELVRLLAGKHRNLCVVGDDDQSIYAFRGANIRNILDFEKVYPDAFVVKLEQNYRSTQNVLDAANAVIRNNTGRKAKSLWTDRGEGTKIHLREFTTARDEAAFVADDIAEKCRSDRHLNYGDFAVLYRTNAQARALEERFVLTGIPYNVVGGTNFYDRREIRDMIAYLKTVENGQDEIAVRRVLNVPKRGIGLTTIGRLADYAVARDITFFEAMERCRNITSLGRATAKIESFVSLILQLREFKESHGLADLLREIIDKTDYNNYLLSSDDEDGEDRISNIDELISKIADYEETAEEPTLSGFLEEVALVSDLDNAEDGSEKVLLMTLHSAKGLEFPHVYLTGLEDGIFPSYMAINSGDEEAEEEERRLAYVGITRAKDDLTLTYSRSRLLRGEVQYNPPSRFLEEIPEELIDSGDDTAPHFGSRESKFSRSGDYDGGDFTPIGSYSAGTGFKSQSGRTARPRLKAVYKKPSTDESKKPYIARAAGSGKSLASLSKGMPAPSEPDYTVGDRVRHIKYGEGTVKAMELTPKDYKVTVLFDEAGQKIMFAAFARLVKC